MKKSTVRIRECTIQTENMPIQTVSCNCESFNSFPRVDEIAVYLSALCKLNKNDSTISGPGFQKDKLVGRRKNAANKVRIIYKGSLLNMHFFGVLCSNIFVSVSLGFAQISNSIF